MIFVAIVQRDGSRLTHALLERIIWPLLSGSGILSSSSSILILYNDFNRKFRTNERNGQNDRLRTRKSTKRRFHSFVDLLIVCLTSFEMESIKRERIQLDSTKSLRPKEFHRKTLLGSLQQNDSDRFFENTLQTLQSGTFSDIHLKCQLEDFER